MEGFNYIFKYLKGIKFPKTKSPKSVSSKKSKLIKRTVSTSTLENTISTKASPEIHSDIISKERELLRIKEEPKKSPKQRTPVLKLYPKKKIELAKQYDEILQDKNHGASSHPLPEETTQEIITTAGPRLKLSDLQIKDALPSKYWLSYYINSIGNGVVGEFVPQSKTIYLLKGLLGEDALGTLAHEARHALDEIFPLTGYEQKILRSAYPKKISYLFFNPENRLNPVEMRESEAFTSPVSERVTTNQDTRRLLLFKDYSEPPMSEAEWQHIIDTGTDEEIADAFLHLEKSGTRKVTPMSLEEQNKIINDATDDEILNALRQSNAYGNTYADNLLKIKADSKNLYEDALYNIRKALLKVGVAATPIVTEIINSRNNSEKKKFGGRLIKKYF